MTLVCSSCWEDIPDDGFHPVIEWNNDDPDDHFCSDTCVFDWMAANNARWTDPAAQPDV